MIIQVGMDQLRDLLAADFAETQLGSDGTAVSLADTALGSAITDTDETATVTTFHNGFKITSSTTAGDGDGSSAREVVTFNGDGTPIAMMRSVFPQIDLGATTVVEVDTQVLLLQEF